MIGKTLAHYEITELLGKGGMGEVYRARDTTLGRDVALKILPRELSGDPERVARFAREARTLASLQHPNVASIYGFEEVEGTRFLTMELVEGDDLSEHLSRGGMSVDEALRIARQVAAGLEAAHAKNIVHRDLKPANIKIGPDGDVKILDFGLARAYADDSVEDGDPETSPTITAAMTNAGVILGTAAYMSPEQARGRPSDTRVDIWAFGVVLFEMLSGKRLFEGETISDTLASVLKTDIDWSPIPADLPPRVRTLLVRCLDRDRSRRLRDIGEARIVLEDELSGAPDHHLESALHSGVLPAITDVSTHEGGRRRWLGIVAAMIVGALLAIGALRVMAPPTSAEIPLRKLALDGGAQGEPTSLPVISPDGTAVAFVTPTQIVVREMSARESRHFPISGIVHDLLWSPDGQSLAYVTPERLYRLDPRSGQQQVVCEADESFTGGSGGSWSPDGTILFSQSDEQGLFQVSERGGDPRRILPVDAEREGDLHDPFVLPEGRGVLFVPHKKSDAFSTIELWTGDERRVLVELEGQTLSDPVYSDSGHILFRRSPTNPGIWAAPFSLDRLEVTGEAFLAAPEGNFPSVSSDGTLVYQSGSTSASLRLTWSDSGAREVTDAGELLFRGGYPFPTVTPDGQLACASIDNEENPDLWIFDATRGTRTRLTFGLGREEFPAWSPSGDAVVYHVRPDGYTATDSMRVVLVAADGTGEPDTLAIGLIPTVSADGQFVAFSSLRQPGGWRNADITVRPITAGRSQGEPLISATGLQMDARVAPSGDFVAYTSNESGSYEIYLTRFPSGDGRWQVSIDGGMWARWNARGDRLFYTRADDIMVVDVSLGDTPQLGRPQLLIERAPLSIPTVVSWAPGFDVSGDGERFVYFRDPDVGATDRQIVVVQNWYAEFDSRD